MADTGTPDDGPSLEMPSFSLRRRRKETSEDPVEEARDEAGREDEPGEDEPGEGDVLTTDPVTPAPEPEPEPEPASRPGVALDDGPPTRAGWLSLSVPGVAAAALAGVAVGVIAVLLAWLAGVGCEAVRGTSACGGAIGLPLLLASLVLLAWVGATLLREMGVADAGSTSVLAVGVLTVLVLVFLLGSLDRWWSVVAVPVAAALAYLGSWWLTTRVVGEDTDVTAPHDVR